MQRGGVFQNWFEEWRICISFENFPNWDRSGVFDLELAGDGCGSRELWTNRSFGEFWKVEEFWGVSGERGLYVCG